MTFFLRVPGSTSNLGPGFDSIGMAVNRYLYLSVKESPEWNIHFIEQPEIIPDLKDNIIYQAATETCKLVNKSLPPLDISMYSEIPFARGLGSSAAAIVAGIEIADIVLGLKLSKKQKANLASKLEGHPDNTTASLYGGLTISTHTEDETDTIVCPPPQIELLALIPTYKLETKTARKVLPKILAYSDAIKGSSISNVLVAAILQDHWEVAGKMMEKDIFHQPYRQTLVPELPRIMAFGRSVGVLGTALSGAGPTIISIVPKDCGSSIQSLFTEVFPNYEYEVLTPVGEGIIQIGNFIEDPSLLLSGPSL